MWGEAGLRSGQVRDRFGGGAHRARSPLESHVDGQEEGARLFARAPGAGPGSLEKAAYGENVSR